MKKSNPDTEFRRELKRLRCEGSIKYTQAELADLAGISAAYISQLETGERKPTPQVIRSISHHLGVSPNHLLKTIGMVEMDIARTFTNNRDKVKDKIPNLSTDQIEEIANYLTYLEFKISVLK